MTHFQQLYYTSCEHGLSGFSGFQFNAVSAGVSAETRQAAEALAGYEPPRSMAESDTPELLERCPVNLCHQPNDRAGHSATTLCVRYVGRDSARRFGNYFAHALHSENFRADAGGMLGIELWNSPVWTRTVSPSTEIPALARPPRGPLDARTVRDFLRGHAHADQLPNLLAAVFAALIEHGSVVVIDHSTERIARWFAAVSYLLPPPLARRLSFATYVFRPARSRLHLIGTVPEAQLDFGPDDEAAYTVFDFSRGVFPEVTVPGLVLLLTRIGVGSVRPVWSWTADYVRGAEETPDDWYAPVAAAAASGDIALTTADVRQVIDWLADADHLGPRRAAVAADIHRKHRDLDDGRLAALSAAAKAGGDSEVHQEIEGKLHGARMRSFMTGAEDAVEPVPISDRAVRERATALWERLLETEVRNNRQRARLLLWALGAGLPTAPETFARETLTLTRTLLGASTAPGFRQEVAELVRVLPEMREALAVAVEEALERPGGQEQLFSQFPAELLDERDLGGRPTLLEHHLRARAEREPQSTVAILFKILKVRENPSPDEDLLHALWRHPSRIWTHKEATLIAEGLPAKAPVDGAVGQWFDRALNQPIRDDAQLSACLHLCRVLSHRGRFAWLPSLTQDRVLTTIDLDTALREAREATELVKAFSVPGAGLHAAPQALKRYRLVPVVLSLPADIGRLPDLMVKAGHSTLDQYLSAVRNVVTGGESFDDALIDHVAAVAAMSTLGLSQAHRESVFEVRRHSAHHWRLADVKRLASRLRPHDAALAEEYDAKVEDRTSGARKLARKLPFLGTRAPSARDDGAPKTSQQPKNSQKKKGE
ncbi:GTPase-associated protein 1-related protein [Streptomyces sp. NBC_01102]|uniref:GTPase-associated protein 1-related protein n=1 Tax=Streptomyces sp. NBC_01102 TaxID=2903749 RepID=UPI0038693AD7|nr:GTPase-associated protein 1-related protein [Streptomyces sp. NBC_01102]